MGQESVLKHLGLGLDLRSLSMMTRKPIRIVKLPRILFDLILDLEPIRNILQCVLIVSIEY